MKAILTLIFVLFIGVAAQAQAANDTIKVETVALSIESTTNNEMFKMMLLVYTRTKMQGY
jgi:predicted S18 family serine protease